MAFAVRNGIPQRKSEDPKPVNDRIISLKFPFVDSWYGTLITLCPEYDQLLRKKVVSKTSSTRYLVLFWVQTKTSFFSNRDAKNSRINGGIQKWLNSRHLLALMIPKCFFYQSMRTVWGPRVLIYLAVCLDVAQEFMNEAPTETRTHSWRFASLASQLLHHLKYPM